MGKGVCGQKKGCFVGRTLGGATNYIAKNLEPSGNILLWKLWHKGGLRKQREKQAWTVIAMKGMQGYVLGQEKNYVVKKTSWSNKSMWKCPCFPCALIHILYVYSVSQFAVNSYESH